MEGSHVAISRTQPVCQLAVFQPLFTWEKRDQETEKTNRAEEQHLEDAGEEFSLKIPQFPGDQRRVRLAKPSNEATFKTWLKLLACSLHLNCDTFLSRSLIKTQFSTLLLASLLRRLKSLKMCLEKGRLFRPRRRVCASAADKRTFSCR